MMDGSLCISLGTRSAERFGVEFREPPKDQFGQVKRYANPFLLAEEKAKKKEERGLRFGLIDPEEKAKKEMRLQKFGPLVPASTTQDEKEAEEPEEDKGKGLELEEEGEEEESMDVGTRSDFIDYAPCGCSAHVVV